MHATCAKVPKAGDLHVRWSRQVGWTPDVKDPLSFVEPKGRNLSQKASTLPGACALPVEKPFGNLVDVSPTFEMSRKRTDVSLESLWMWRQGLAKQRAVSLAP